MAVSFGSRGAFKCARAPSNVANDLSVSSEMRASTMLRGRDQAIVFVELKVVRDPQRRRFAQRRRRAGKIEIAAGAPRIIYVAHRFQRDAHEELNTLTRGLYVSLDRDIERNVVRGADARQEACSPHREHAQPP